MKPKTPKEELEARRQRRKLFLVHTGVYLVLVVGVLSSQAITLSKNLMASLQPVELGQMGGSMLVAGALYNKMESDRKLAKPGSVWRLLRNAFYHGFFWMTILGAWW